MRQEIDMNDWERRDAQAWAEIDDYYARGEAGEADFRERIGALAGELPQDNRSLPSSVLVPGTPQVTPTRLSRYTKRR